MVDKCTRNDTGMLAIKLKATQVDEFISGDARYNELSIACYNRYVPKNCDFMHTVNKHLLITEARLGGAQ